MAITYWSHLSILLIVLNFSTNSVIEQVTVTDKVWFDIEIENQSIGRIVIGLFGEILPVVVGNFIKLAEQEKRGYKNTIFHRVEKNFMIQGGDNGDTTIHDPNFQEYAEKNFRLKQFGAGCVSLANIGKPSGSQFFISTMDAYWLKNYHAVFGKVLEGMHVVREIEYTETDQDAHPTSKVVIVNAGAIKLQPNEYFFTPCSASPEDKPDNK